MTIDPDKWLEYANLVFSADDTVTDALFLHGWGDLMDEMVDATASLFKKCGAKYLCVNGEPVYDTATPTIGFLYVRERLIGRHAIPETAIIPITPGRHSGEEAESFISFTKKHAIESATIISVPQHILRAFLTQLEVTRVAGVALKLLPKTIGGIDWEQPIRVEGLMGQTLQETTRVGRMVNECARIMAYRKKYEAGDTTFPIATPEEAVDYLKSVA